MELYKRALASVNTQLHSNCQANVQKNRNVLTIIVDTTKIFDRRNLPVKGHSDSVKEQKKVGMSETNSSGNFVKLFHYRSFGVITI